MYWLYWHEFGLMKIQSPVFDHLGTLRNNHLAVFLVAVLMMGLKMTGSVEFKCQDLQLLQQSLLNQLLFLRMTLVWELRVIIKSYTTKITEGNYQDIYY